MDHQENNRIFEALVGRGDFVGASDEGVRMTDQEMQRLEQQLRDRYAGQEYIMIPQDTLDEAQQQIEEGWPFSGETAIISGKLRVDSDIDDDQLIEMLGDVLVPNTDGALLQTTGEQDDIYCHVMDARLEFLDFDIVTDWDDQGYVCDVQVEYRFGYSDDKSKTVTFFGARPAELHRHAYETVVSWQEARGRLESAWPDACDQMDEVLQDDTQPIVEQLAVITDIMSDALADEEYRRYVEVYVNESLELNPHLPYGARVQDELDVYHGGSPLREGYIPVPTSYELQFDVYQPQVRFTRPTTDDPTAVETCIEGATHNDYDGDEPERVVLPLQNVLLFEQTWRRDSLLNELYTGVKEELASRAIDELE